MGIDAAARKELAARASLAFVKEGMTLGIGTGSTVDALIDVLAEAPRAARHVASSERSAARLAERGFACVGLGETDGIDLYIDGADEYTERFTLLKGGGGAHVREKVLAAAARSFVVIADAGKRVDVLGAFPVAVEVLPLARSLVARKLAALGARPALRTGFTSDEGNAILDCAGLRITDAAELERNICALPGVVDCGVCALRPADVILAAGPDGAVVKLVR